MALNSLPQTRVIENKSEHNHYIACVMRDCVIELRCQNSDLGKISPGHSREIVVLNMITSIIEHIVYGTIV